MSTTSVNDADFQSEVLEADKPVLVDFWAEWCGPCKAIGPALEELSEELGSDIKITKMNVDENEKTPMDFNVRAVPTLLIFKDGKVAAQQQGALPKNKLAEWIKDTI